MRPAVAAQRVSCLSETSATRGWMRPEAMEPMAMRSAPCWGRMLTEPSRKERTGMMMALSQSMTPCARMTVASRLMGSLAA